MGDLIDRQTAIDELKNISFSHWFEYGEYLSEDIREIEIISSSKALEVIEELPSAQPERKKMSNKEWVDFLSEQFTVSRASAREMLHGLMKLKAEDNFKKQYSGGRNEKG